MANQQRRYQDGSIRQKKRKNGRKVWEFRWREGGVMHAMTVGALETYPSKSSALRSPEVQSLLLKLNSASLAVPARVTVGELCGRYEKEELPEVCHSTQLSYRTFLNNYIRPRWGEAELGNIKVVELEEWLRTLRTLEGGKMAPSTRGHIKTLLSTIFKCAQRWGLLSSNPIKLVKVKGGSRRLQRPQILTPSQFQQVLAHLSQPYHTMVLIAGTLGLRAGEIVGLKWEDFNLSEGWVRVERGVVHGRVGDVKTEYSRDAVPLAPELVEALQQHRQAALASDEGWVFPSPVTGRPYHQEEVQKSHIIPALEAVGVWKEGMGWKTFRHSYRSWLDSVDAPMGVQRELMRHASIQTTMNVYGRAMSEGKRQAHGKVVEMLVPVRKLG
jgi:integrase